MHSIERLLPVAALIAVLGVPVHADAQEKIRFVTSWRAQGEHGGFYQAAATELYQKAGLCIRSTCNRS